MQYSLQGGRKGMQPNSKLSASNAENNQLLAEDFNNDFIQVTFILQQKTTSTCTIPAQYGSFVRTRCIINYNLRAGY